MSDFCLWCGKDLSLERHGNFCSKSCQSKYSYEKGKEKRNATCLERYGAENPAQSKQARQKLKERNLAKTEEQKKQIIDKRKNTNLLRYGVAVPMNLPEHKAARDSSAWSAPARQKRKQTCLKRYGAETNLMSEEQLKKTKRFNLENYGVEHTLQRTDVIEKRKQTNLERYGVVSTLQTRESVNRYYEVLRTRYGVDHPMRSPEIQKKARETLKGRYGESFPMKCPSIAERIRNSCIARYGVDNYAKTREMHVKSGRTLYSVVASDGTRLDSHYELYVYEFCKLHKLDFERQKRIRFQVEEKEHYTFIDFEINGKLYEVKGAHLLEGCFDYATEVKMSDKLRVYRENGVTVITDDLPICHSILDNAVVRFLDIRRFQEDDLTLLDVLNSVE